VSQEVPASNPVLAGAVRYLAAHGGAHPALGAASLHGDVVALTTCEMSANQTKEHQCQS
jgi:hypothetical protein